MELVVWNAARRLALIVAGAMLLVAVPFVRDARVGPLPGVAGAVAFALLALSLVPLVRARRLLRLAAQPPAPPAASRTYRASAKAEDLDPVERAATHHAAIALVLLAFAGSLVVVAAAAR